MAAIAAWIVRMESDPDRSIDGCAQTGCFVDVRPGNWQVRNTSAVSCMAASLWLPPPATRNLVNR